MKQLLATYCIILAMATLAMMPAGGIVAPDHASLPEDRARVHHHDHHSSIYHSCAHHAGEPCRHDETGMPDCAGACAAMAGCMLQVVPCDGLAVFVSRGTDRIAGQEPAR